jgi:hypothetical protein
MLLGFEVFRRFDRRGVDGGESGEWENEIEIKTPTSDKS